MSIPQWSCYSVQHPHALIGCRVLTQEEAAEAPAGSQFVSAHMWCNAKTTTSSFKTALDKSAKATIEKVGMGVHTNIIKFVLQRVCHLLKRSQLWTPRPPLRPSPRSFLHPGVITLLPPPLRSTCLTVLRPRQFILFPHWDKSASQNRWFWRILEVIIQNLIDHLQHVIPGSVLNSSRAECRRKHLLRVVFF